MKQLWQTLDIGNMFRPTFGFKNPWNFQFKKIKSPKNYSPPNFYHPTWGKFTPPYTSLDLAQNLLNDRL